MRPAFVYFGLCALACSYRGVHGQDEGEDEEGGFEDLQTEFYLPYSETEDVDFSIVRPGGFGCYQW